MTDCGIDALRHGVPKSANVEKRPVVDAGNAGRLVAAGATYLVAGTALFREPDLGQAIQALRRAATAGAAS